MDADVVKFLTAAFLVIYKFMKCFWQINEMVLAKIMKWVWQSYEMGLIKGRPSGIPLSTVMNHIPLHPITIKSHPNLISIPPKPSTVVSDVSTISRCFITHHIITPSFHHHYSSPSISVILLSFIILDLFHLYYVPSIILGYVARWSTFNVFTFLWWTITLLFLWSYDFILSILLPLNSVLVYLRISVHKELLRFSKTPVCNRLNLKSWLQKWSGTSLKS